MRPILQRIKNPSRRRRLLRFLSPRFRRNGNGQQQQLYAVAAAAAPIPLGVGKAKARRLGFCPFSRTGKRTRAPTPNPTNTRPSCTPLLCSYSAVCSQSGSRGGDIRVRSDDGRRVVSRVCSVSTCSAVPVPHQRGDGPGRRPATPATISSSTAPDNSSQLNRGNLPDGHQLILVGL